MILKKIVDKKREEVEQSKKVLPIQKLERGLKKSEFDFKKVINGLDSNNKINLIAEIKRKSPSSKDKDINKNFNFKKIVSIYEKNNYVNAISILTDKDFFGGDKTLIGKARKISKKPILRKDFIIDEYQVYESRHIGADAILLIAAILSKKEIEKFINLAKSYNMASIVEVHDENEILKIPKNAEIIGINNRNLDTLKIDINTTNKLAKIIKQKFPDAIIISESGLETRRDLSIVENNANAVLIGTSIIKSENIDKKINELFRPKIKICGIINTNDALIASSLGADYLGFIFYDKSKRYIHPTKAKKIIDKIKNEYSHVKFVGVFVNENINEVKRIKEYCSLDLVQLHGDESAEFSNEFSNDDVIKVFRINNDKFSFEKIKKYKTNYILFDTYSKNEYGGTGTSFEWKKLKDSNIKDLKKRIFLAGGVNENNILNAIKINPYAIDISSGVEKSPGIKDEKKLKNLFNKIKER